MNLRGLDGWKTWRHRLPLLTAVVQGDSMAPSYRQGDWVVIRRTTRVRPGQVVAAPDPRAPERLLVKRVDRPVAGGWWVLGDNPSASTDSRVFGPIRPEAVVGRVLLRYHRS